MSLSFQSGVLSSASLLGLGLETRPAPEVNKLLCETGSLRPGCRVRFHLSAAVAADGGGEKKSGHSYRVLIECQH